MVPDLDVEIGLKEWLEELIADQIQTEIDEMLFIVVMNEHTCFSSTP
jgi:hypothetical protein